MHSSTPKIPENFSNINYLRDLGPLLIEQGYQIVPLPLYKKYPASVAGWQNLRLKAKDLNNYVLSGYAGIGVLTNNIIGVDVDVNDPLLAAELQILLSYYGIDLIRVGSAPRFLGVARSDVTEKITSASYAMRDNATLTAKIEILSVGQQFVAYNLHPDTQKPYTWGIRELYDVKQEDLAYITKKECEHVLKKLYELVADHYDVVAGAHIPASKKVGMETTELSLIKKWSPLDSISDEQIREALDKIKADDYGIWVSVGMGLHHQYVANEKGLGLWDRWSQKSKKYQKGETIKKWNSFSINIEHSEPTTAATILYLAKSSTSSAPPISYFKHLCGLSDTEMISKYLKHFVYIASPGGVIDCLSHPITLVPYRIFKELTAAHKRMIIPNEESKSKKIKSVPLSQIWLEHEDRQTVSRLGWEPSRNTISCVVQSKETNELIINTYENKRYKRDNTVTLSDSRCNKFVNHIQYLFPTTSEQDWFFDWVSMSLQHPEERTRVTPIHISTHFGTGRGWLTQFFKTILLRQYVTTCTTAQLSGEVSSSAYQDYLNQSLICVVDEIKDKHGEYTLSDKIRDVLTEPYLSINLKYGMLATKKIYTNFIFYSNHIDALIINDRDRRFNVTIHSASPKSQQYYVALYHILEDDNAMSAIFNALLNRKIDYVRCAAPIQTQGKRILLESTKSDAQCLIENAVEHYEAQVWVLSTQFITHINEVTQTLISPRQLGATLIKLGYSQKRIRYKGQRVRVWCLDIEHYDDPLKIILEKLDMGVSHDVE